MEVYVPLATHENEILFRLQHSQSQSVDALGYGKSQEYGLKKKQIFVDLFVTKADKRGQGKSFYYPTTHQKLGTPSYQSPKKGEENRKYFVGKEFHIFFSYSLRVFFFLIIALTGDFIFIPVTCGVRSEYRLFKKENQMNFNFHKTNFFELH